MDVRTCPCGLVVSGHDLDERVEALREGREQALLHSAIAMLPPGYRSPGMENETLRDHEK